MSAEILSLVPAPEPEARAVNQDLVSALETFLEMARTGEVVSGAAVMLMADLSTQFAVCAATYPLTILGAIDIMHHDARCRVSRETDA